MGLFDKLKQGLQRTTQQLKDRFDDIVGLADSPEARTREIDVDTAETLEEILLMADVGVAASGGDRRGGAQTPAARRELARAGQAGDAAGPRAVRRSAPLLGSSELRANRT